MSTKQILSIYGLSLALFTLPCASNELVSDQAVRSSAKDLFYRQIKSPSVALNTGMQYWIELKRGGQVSKVNSKFAFKSGDGIRIHVKSNTDAFAYIFLKEGSSGERSILFPDSRFHDNNTLKAETDYSLPADGFLKFDQNPGTEKLILLVSRHQLDANKYLADKTRKHVLIGTAQPGSKDLIPGSVVLAYTDQDQPAPEKLQTENTDNQKQKTGTVTSASANGSQEEDAITILVQKDPSEVLAVDLALLHQR